MAGEPNADDLADTNFAAIRNLRRRKAIVQSAFYGSIAFMPLSCLGGCGIGALIKHENTAMIFYAIGILAPFVGLGAMMLMWGDRGRYGRSFELAQQAYGLGLLYTEKPSADQTRVVDAFDVFRDHDHEAARDHLAGERAGMPIVIMDYSCAWGHGKWAYVIDQTVIILENAAPDAPDLLVYPRGLLGKLKQAIGLESKPIKLPGEEEFNDAYGLYAADADAAAALFTSELTALCTKEDDLVIEVSDGSVLVYWTNTRFPPKELKGRLGRAITIAVLLQVEGQVWRFRMK